MSRGQSASASRCSALLAPSIAALGLFLLPGPTQAQRPIAIGSKTFTESYVLAEIMAQALEAEGIEVVRRPGLGGTLICYQALINGDIDVYPEYTGTISQTILERPDDATLAALRAPLATRGLQTLPALGFDNTYALAVSGATGVRPGLTRISDLPRFPQLRIALSHEFLNRPDGWPGLVEAYALHGMTPTGIEHGLAYQALADGSIDLTDVYSTDGDIVRYGLRVLRDDRSFFPEYLAVPLARSDLPANARAVLARLAGRLSDERMRRLNGEATVEGREFADIANEFLRAEGLAGEQTRAAATLWPRLWRNTLRHLQLTVVALLLAGIVGVVGGILVYRSRRISRLVLYVAGLLQTIPSIALLALMIPLFGIGVLPAVVALFLYSLLPILRNTITALLTIDPLLKRVAEAMGLTRSQQIRHVLLPLSMPNVMAGIRTAAVISIGTATLAAFIGAGGLGEPIVTGLALNDVDLILQGAVPAALLALFTELAFELLERRLVPEHMLSGKLPE